MNLIIRLYWQYDLDLLSLHAHPDFSLSKTMKEMLRAYTRGDIYGIPLPSPQPFKTTLTNTSIHIYLNPKTDGDVIDMLHGFRTGMRNSAIKNLYRAYLDAPRMDPFFNDSMYTVKTRVSEKRDVQPLRGKRFTRPNNTPVSEITEEKKITKTETFKNVKDHETDPYKSNIIYGSEPQNYDEKDRSKYDIQEKYYEDIEEFEDDDFDFDSLIQSMIDSTT